MTKIFFDPKAPKSLVTLQQWFGSIITQKIEDDNSLSLTTATGSSVADEAEKYIVSTHRLSAYKRMELYSQSYWLRLLAALHEEFPFLMRLFGEEGFNRQLGIPYLDTHPPSHWSLNALGNAFFSWIESHYNDADKKFVLMAAKLDWACQEAFFTKALPRIDLNSFSGEKAEDLFSTALILQPYVHLFAFPSHLLHYREAFLKEKADFWLENDFPLLCKDKEYFFIVYRNAFLRVEWEELSFKEYELLLHIQKGSSIEDAATLIENWDNVEEELPFWIQKWLLQQWVTVPQIKSFGVLPTL